MQDAASTVMADVYMSLLTPPTSDAVNRTPPTKAIEYPPVGSLTMFVRQAVARVRQADQSLGEWLGGPDADTWLPESREKHSAQLKVRG